MLLKRKIINLLMVGGKKYCSEILFKKTLKKLLKINKKNTDLIIYTSINSFVYGFKLTTTDSTLKKQAFKKQKPFFLNNKARICFGLKFMTGSSKKLKHELLTVLIKHNDLTNFKTIEHQQILKHQNILIFYRY